MLKMRLKTPRNKYPEADALHATDLFYKQQGGFQESVESAIHWVKQYVSLPQYGNVLDLCCGEGNWSKAIKSINSSLKLYGIDISDGAIQQAQEKMNEDKENFITGNVEPALPYPDNFFHLIFARGPGLYNQHSMDRDATIKVIENWHQKLENSGSFYSIFYSDPKQMGAYTAPDKVKLPYNRFPRKTETLDFSGGKYHHTIQSFLIPFWKAKNVTILRYSFIENLHILVTKRNLL